MTFASEQHYTPAANHVRPRAKQHYVHSAVHDTLNQLTAVKVVLDFLEMTLDEGATDPGKHLGFAEKDWDEMVKLAVGSCRNAIHKLEELHQYADSR